MDVIKHLSGEEISKDPAPGGRLSRLATHILNQRRHALSLYLLEDFSTELISVLK